jgi:DHA1 family tetracycline resistance protein-like MFS transporter
VDSLAKETAPRRAALAFVLVTIVLDMLAMAIVIPVLPKLVLSFMHGDTATASRVIGIFGTVWALMQFIFAPVLGALSDRFGRRRVILISSFGLGMDYVLMALAPGITVLFVGRIISGITAASFSTAGAYIADVSPPEKRAGNFGLMSVAFGLGFILGPAVGGVLGQFSPRLPFWVAAGLSLTNAAYGMFILPESLAPDRRTAFSWRKANPVGSLKLLRSHAGLLGLAMVYFIYWLAYTAVISVFVLYGTYRYGWDSATVGLTLGGVGLSSALVGGLLVKPIVARLGERTSLLIGLLFGTAGIVIMGLAAHPIMFWSAIPVMSLMGLTQPSLQGLMTQRILPTEQGRLQGAIGSVQAIASMIGPTLFSFVFAQGIAGETGIFHAKLPGAPYYLSAILMVSALILAARLARPEPMALAGAVKPL